MFQAGCHACTSAVNAGYAACATHRAGTAGYGPQQSGYGQDPLLDLVEEVVELEIMEDIIEDIF